MVKKEFDYKDARQELDEILAWFESSNPDLDKALIKYKRAEELIKQTEDYLKDIEKKLKITVNKA